MKRRKRGSTWTWRGVMARIIRKSYTFRKRSQARTFIRLENPHVTTRFPWTSKSDKLPEYASNSCSTLNVRRSRNESCKVNHSKEDYHKIIMGPNQYSFKQDCKRPNISRFSNKVQDILLRFHYAQILSCIMEPVAQLRAFPFRHIYHVPHPTKEAP